MKKTFIFLVYTFFGVALQAQINFNLPVDLGMERGFFQSVPTLSAVTPTVQGTPFVHDTWLAGELTLSNGRVVKNQALSYRFDGYNNLVYFKNHTDKEMVLVNEGIVALDLIQPDSSVWRLKHIAMPNAPKPHYLVRVLYEGNGIIFLQDLRKTIYEPDPKQTSAYQTDEAKKPHFKEGYTYWVKKPNSTFERVTLKKKSITELAPARMEKSVASFCDKNGYRNSLSEAEAIELLKFMFK
jgi:hypothetical protein